MCAQYCKDLLQLIDIYINNKSNNSIDFVNNMSNNWRSTFKLAQRQGVLALVWSAVCRLAESGALTPEQLPDRALKLQWVLSTEKIAGRYKLQRHLATKLAEAYAMAGIQTYVLKGLAISGYYPTPEHRECGDLDCFLASTTEDGAFVCRYYDGNDIAAKIGAKVDIGFYRHSHIHYNGLMVENHAFCTAVRGSRDRKALERHLQHLLATKPSAPIEGTHLLRPCADFNALFLTAHSFGHCLTEGIKLRHILDWALLLNAEQDNIDWKSFYEWCDRMHYTKFADALTAISVKYLGLTIINSKIHQHSVLADKVLDDIMNANRLIHNTGASKFKKRLMIIRNHIFGGWKYRELYEKSAFIETMKMVLAFFIERKPQI